ncbi:MAG: hypothetical protein IJE48_08105 [Clostridia bacterium]|nr:hypothetical protein [Clostridia bacterium]
MKKIKIISGIMSAIFILLSLSIFITERYTDYSFLAGNIDGTDLNIIFAVLSAVCLLISATTAIISKNEKHTVLNSVIRIICICVICLFAAVTTTVNSEHRYFEFSSPDGEYTVIAKEWSYLLGGGVVFYERVNPLIVEIKDSIGIDDGYCVISAGDYSVEWEENIMKFTASNGNGLYKTIYITN